MKKHKPGCFDNGSKMFWNCSCLDNKKDKMNAHEKAMLDDTVWRVFGKSVETTHKLKCPWLHDLIDGKLECRGCRNVKPSRRKTVARLERFECSFCAGYGKRQMIVRGTGKGKPPVCGVRRCVRCNGFGWLWRKARRKDAQ